jgi:hypothetical protein
MTHNKRIVSQSYNIMMKYHESYFDDYLQNASGAGRNLHPKSETEHPPAPTLRTCPHMLFYGPEGVGKYTQALQRIQKYSPSRLKYEKKLNVTFNKETYLFKISDIHYEIDMGLLGCNSKSLWHEIYTQIMDIVASTVKKDSPTAGMGIVLCKNMHEIHSELLDNFYSYLQPNHPAASQRLIFFLLSKDMSFLPDNLVHACEVLSFARPSRNMYRVCLGRRLQNHSLLATPERIQNIKKLYLKDDGEKPEIIIQNQHHEIICRNILQLLEQPRETFSYAQLRDTMYDMLIYNLDIPECMWFVMREMGKSGGRAERRELMRRAYEFFRYFNNNYRPIYHLERFFLTGYRDAVVP